MPEKQINFAFGGVPEQIPVCEPISWICDTIINAGEIEFQNTSRRQV